MPLSLTTMAVTLSEANAYATARAKTVWTSASTGKDEALRRGQDYIAAKYQNMWLTDIDNSAAPDAVKFAIIEAAIRELAVPFSLTPDFVEAERVKTAEAGPVSVTYADTTNPGAMLPTISAIEYLLAGLIIRNRYPAMMVVG